MAARKNDPKRTEEYGQVTYEVAEDQEIPEHLIREERRKARLRRR